ncbi:MAG TPA: AI-2E family transporter [Acidimicrobiales bacterium]|nr:AI-2E family transporter [Acidimicrobiales bacterium]
MSAFQRRTTSARRVDLGEPGQPFNRRSPLFVGFTGAIGVGLAYLLGRTLVDLGSVLTIFGVALFLAIGLEPAVDWQQRHRIPRWAAVLIVLLAVAALVGGFVAAAVSPIASEVSELTKNLPRYRSDLTSGKGWLGHLVSTLHLQSVVKNGGTSTFKPKLSWLGGVLGAGRIVVNAVTATISVFVLTIYFLVAFPKLRALWLGLVPRSRRARIEPISDEVFSRVGGFVLGNLVTSIVSGALTTIWLSLFGVPYPVLLGLFVALFDLIPVIGSTVAGAVVTAVSLVKGVPVAVGTLGFYIFYRFFEDYLLTPRVMRHTVAISPGLTIVATLIGVTLLGLIGALVAIPAAAAVRLVVEEVILPRMEEL